MALSSLNRRFLSALNKLDIDVKQFPDKTFDGLFDFVPDSTCHFFDWFLENITPDNCLTQTERATYYLLESTQSLPTEEEVKYVLSSHQPSYEEPKSLDLNFVNNFLPQELEDLKVYGEELSNIYQNLELEYNEAKKNQIILKEKIKSEKQKLASEVRDFYEVNSTLKASVNEVKNYLLKEPSLNLKFELFTDLLTCEGDIFNKVKIYKLLENEISDYSKLGLLPELEENLLYTEVSKILINGFTLVKKTKIDFLMELIQKKSTKTSTHNLISPYLSESEEVEAKISEDIKLLELELFNKKKKSSHEEIQKISEGYYLCKTDLYRLYISKLTTLLEYLKSNSQLSSVLLHILLRCNQCLEKTVKSRKSLHSKLNEYEIHFSNDITNLELRRQRFTDIVAHQTEHPLLSEIENSDRCEGSLKNVLDLMTKVNENPEGVQLRSQIQSSIKTVLHSSLCGPTNMLLLIPVELMINFQDAKNRVGCLSQGVKRLANKYVETKEKISKQQRKELLAWINFITQPQVV